MAEVHEAIEVDAPVKTGTWLPLGCSRVCRWRPSREQRLHLAPAESPKA
jgi:hypothetical protein